MNRFIDTLLGQCPDRPPVWMMRQAGRYLTEFREERAKTPDFMQFCHDIDAVVRVTLQPFKRFDLDAAIIFSDILTIPYAMGHNVRFIKGEGPILDKPLTPGNVLRNLQDDQLTFVMQGIHATRQTMNEQNMQHIPLLGFSATPWTLMCYLMEGTGSKQGFHKAQTALKEHPNWCHSIAKALNTYIIDYVLRQVDAGANAIMLFDSWASLVPQPLYESIFIPCQEQLIHHIHQHTDVPVVLFAKEANTHLDYLVQTGADGLSVGLDHDIPTLCQQYPHVTWQGNLDPDLLKHGHLTDIDRAIDAMLPQEPARYIANLAHGIRPETPVDHVSHFVQRVVNHQWTTI